MRLFPFFLRYTRQQQRGIISLLVLIVLFQAGYFILTSVEPVRTASEEEKAWLALQPQIDSLKLAKGNTAYTIYPFNPNFITDHKGYMLGMSVVEIDRLHKFRAQNKYVNSAAEFQQVTGVSDSLLGVISPYFKFPDWVTQKQKAVASRAESKNTRNGYTAKTAEVEKTDINDAVEEDLVKVYGIGPAYAKKILRRRAQLGAFVNMEQMADFPEFSPEAVDGLNKMFFVGSSPDVTKLNINTGSLNQLTYFAYFNKDIAKAIITRRSMYGKIPDVEDLAKINGFPIDKLKIIALYLEF